MLRNVRNLVHHNLSDGLSRLCGQWPVRPTNTLDCLSRFRRLGLGEVGISDEARGATETKGLASSTAPAGQDFRSQRIYQGANQTATLTVRLTDHTYQHPRTSKRPQSYGPSCTSHAGEDVSHVTAQARGPPIHSSADGSALAEK